MIIKIFTYFLLTISINCQKNEFGKDLFLDWGIKNNFKIPSYIDISYLKKNKIKFSAKEDIHANTELLTIPNIIMFNISKALELIDSKNLNNQYKKFSQINLTYNQNEFDFRKDESFLAYILYLFKHKPKKYAKTKFFENFQYYLDSLKKYYIKSPLFYDQKQIEWLAGSYLSHSYDMIIKDFQDEMKIFGNDSYYKRDLDNDDYAHNRLVIHNKGLNISNQWTLVPFLNYIEEDYSKYNSNYTIEKNGDVKIFSIKELKKGDEIILKSKKKTNIQMLLLEGKTDEELVDYFEEYIISAFSPGLYYNYGINDIKYFRNYYLNILEKDFESKAIKLYRDNMDILQGDGTDIWGYNILETNMYSYKEFFENVNLDKIYEMFYGTDDRINIERIFRGESKLMDKIYDKVVEKMEKLYEIERKEKREKREKMMKEKESDL